MGEIKDISLRLYVRHEFFALSGNNQRRSFRPLFDRYKPTSRHHANLDERRSAISYSFAPTTAASQQPVSQHAYGLLARTKALKNFSFT
jgi:hypothetical protein